MSVASAAKSYLVGESGVLVGLLAPIKVLYSEPRDILRSIVYAGDVAGPVELMAMANGARIKRSEEFSFPLIVRIWQPGRSTREAGDAQADAIYDQVSDYIAANWTLGDIPYLKKAAVTEMDLSGWTDDDGAGSVLTMTVQLTSYRT